MIATVACSGTSAPTSPSRLAADVEAGSATSSSHATAAKPQTGTAGTVFADIGGVPGFEAATLNGESGRNVELTGDIVGINFEPGTCNPGVDTSLGFETFCVVFGD